ncbi:conserved domain protein [delta proteobacterium NaphS2]|nr:conserved domain protein [delta proteobacterium NaphS2]
MTELVRSLQRQENSPDCFKKSGGDCDQKDCFWRKWCLKPNNNRPEE